MLTWEEKISGAANKSQALVLLTSSLVFKNFIKVEGWSQSLCHDIIDSDALPEWNLVCLIKLQLLNLCSVYFQDFLYYVVHNCFCSFVFTLWLLCSMLCAISDTWECYMICKCWIVSAIQCVIIVSVLCVWSSLSALSSFVTASYFIKKSTASICLKTNGALDENVARGLQEYNPVFFFAAMFCSILVTSLLKETLCKRK